MMSRSTTAALLALACGAAGCGADAPAQPTVPVVVVVFDAFDGARVGHLGHDRNTTPHLDALAAEGTSFRNALAPAPYTLAGVASLVTGRLPDTHGLVAKRQRLGPEEQTLAEVLGQAGYPSLAVVGNPNGGEIFGSMQGFDEVIATYELGPDRPANYTPPSTGEPLHMSTPEESTAELARWAARGGPPAQAGAPFFYYTHILQPHTPYIAPEPFRSTWLEPGYDGLFAGGDNQTLIRHKWRTDEVTARDEQALLDLYDGNILWADHGLGLLVAELKRLGVYEDALILVTADHGEACYQHGVRGHNDTLYDEMLRVPLVVRFPDDWDVPRGTIVDDVVSTMDLLPTVCEALDRAAPPRLDGESLLPLVQGAGPQAGPPSTGRRLVLRDHGTPPSVGFRTDEHKAIWHRDRTGPDREPLQNAFLFYDLTTDPGEHDALDARDAEWVAGFVPLLTDFAAFVDSQERRGTKGGISAEDEAMLDALGYIDEPAD